MYVFVSVPDSFKINFAGHPKVANDSVEVHVIGNSVYYQHVPDCVGCHILKKIYAHAPKEVVEIGKCQFIDSGPDTFVVYQIETRDVTHISSFKQVVLKGLKFMNEYNTACAIFKPFE